MFINLKLSFRKNLNLLTQTNNNHYLLLNMICTMGV